MPPRYANLDPTQAVRTGAEVFRWSVLDKLTGKRRVAPAGDPAPSVAADLAAVADLATPRVTWIGHASFLATLGGAAFLVDPVFSPRIGFLVRRHGNTGLAPADLPPLTALLVTHNHYDHLDAPSIALLPRDVPVFAPAGLGVWFRRRGFARVREMAWWDRAQEGPLTLTFVPSQHWSRRRLADFNESLWGGYVVEAQGRTLYHAGDSGRFDGFAEIGRRHPSIDLALQPIGAYAPAWFMERFHMNPEQAVEAFEALGAHAMVPMHWGAFQLTDEPLLEPVERLRRAWAARSPRGRLHVLAVGGSLSIGASS